MRLPKTTLEQWRVLQAVVDFGGFAQAASHLNRSQSAVSYTVSQLQQRAGVDLLVVSGRKARLTEAGASLLAEISPLIEDWLRVEDRARHLHDAQPVVRLSVDSIYPRDRLFAALRAFTEAYPLVEVVFREAARLATPDALDHDVAITAWQPGRADQHHLCDIDMRPVARPDYALHRSSAGPWSATTLARHRSVAVVGNDVASQSAAPEAQDGLRWQVNTLEAAVEGVVSGLCWGWLPMHLARPYLDTGQLVPLELTGPSRRAIPVALCFADEASAGPATRALAAYLREA